MAVFRRRRIAIVLLIGTIFFCAIANINSLGNVRARIEALKALSSAEDRADNVELEEELAVERILIEEQKASLRDPTNSETYTPKNKALIDHAKFWQDFHPLLNHSEPRIEGEIKVLGELPFKELGFRPDHPELFRYHDNVALNKSDFRIMRKQHAKFMKLLRDVDAPRLPYKKGTRGVATTAGGPMMAVLVTSLHMLRRTGSTLPVEVFIADDSEYDPWLCEEYLPNLNATCINISDVLKAAPLRDGLKKYQFKIFSILFSSFEEVLFLDADCFPLRDPVELFESKVYKDHGLITWPDFWKVLYSPYFFNITGQHRPDYFPYASTESGQLLVSKKSHEKMLLLSTYYNFYGPDKYYKLLSQGGPGEGDKETFIPAAVALDLPFYDVSTGPSIWGYWDRQHTKWEGGVMFQVDPIWDNNLPDFKKYAFSWTKQPWAPANVYFFCHANVPKLDPIRVFDHNGKVWDDEGKPRRMWETVDSMFERIGWDIEGALWHALKSTACDLEHGNYTRWKDREEKLCSVIEDFIDEMHDIETGKKPGKKIAQKEHGDKKINWG
ncbi:alpha-1,2-mannosyltransferase [Ascosphaera apis ARSEF 7405]|uniref:Alpha-1,2-mannosyltransferase n=1 Tax=Ascosphaera apis ARSEF 7405 TaxID=392613 RepID=A0A168AH76_9EURO|nr:alpha-1,2-mannosyltransferase [Ascosphaera apis ARSEF 7405]